MLHRQLNSTENSTISSQLLSESLILYNPENCHLNTRIRAFLRLSRLASDDLVKEHLNEISPSDCHAFFETKILSHWKARANIINYCYSEAAMIRSAIKIQETFVDTSISPTIDPYAANDAKEKLQNKFASCEIIENWVKNELEIETIVREHTTDVLNQKCYYHDWLRDFQRTISRSKPS